MAQSLRDTEKSFAGTKRQLASAEAELKDYRAQAEEEIEVLKAKLQALSGGVDSAGSGGRKNEDTEKKPSSQKEL